MQITYSRCHVDAAAISLYNNCHGEVLSFTSKWLMVGPKWVICRCMKNTVEPQANGGTRNHVTQTEGVKYLGCVWVFICYVEMNRWSVLSSIFVYRSRSGNFPTIDIPHIHEPFRPT